MANTSKLARGLLLAGLLMISAQASAQATLVLLEFEFVEEMQDPRTAQSDQNRLVLVNDELNRQIEACAAFKLIDEAPATSIILQARSRMAYLHRCNGCATKIGAAADAQFVLFPWVQKVSNLILNLNAEIRSAATDRVVVARSVDIRGNTDRSWMRGARALAGRICELDGHRLSSVPAH